MSRLAHIEPIQRAPTSVAAFVGPVAIPSGQTPTVVTSFSAFESSFGGLLDNPSLGYVVAGFFRNGGREALISQTAGSSWPTDEARLIDYRQALDVLEQHGVFNLLAVPPPSPGWSCSAAAPIYAAAAEVCTRTRALLIVDPPTGFDVGAAPTAQLGVAAPDVANAAVFYPEILEPQAVATVETLSVAPSGAVAGAIARTDLARGVWRSAGGATLMGAAGLSRMLSDAEHASLNPRAINTLRAFRGHTPVIWGARTLAGADTSSHVFKYIPVRRLALFIEESVARWPMPISKANDETLWTEVRDAVSTFLHGLFLDGAFVGARPDRAYLVQCDNSTMTAHDIDSGTIRIRVGFAPLRPAEFVFVDIARLLRPCPTNDPC